MQLPNEEYIIPDIELGSMASGLKGLSFRDLTFLFALSAIIFIIDAESIKNKSPVWDEPFYTGVGYYMTRTWYLPWERYAVSAPIIYHPPISYYFNSIPFFALDIMKKLPEEGLFMLGKSDEIRFPPQSEGEKIMFRDDYPERYAYRFIYDDRYSGLSLLFYSRISMLLLLFIADIYLFRLLKENYGFETACILTTIFSFNPNILAHSALATTDIAPVCFNLVAFYYFFKFTEEVTPLNGIKAGISLGFALLSKVTSLYLIPLFAFLLVRESKGRIRSVVTGKTRLCVVFAVFFTLATLNAAYFFKGMDLSFIERQDSGDFVHLLSRLPSPVTKYYIFQLFVTKDHMLSWHPNYLMGTVNGPQYNPLFSAMYWTTVFAVKTPEGLIALALIALTYYLVHPRRNEVFRNNRLARFSAWNLVFSGFVVLSTNAFIGIRLALFIIPTLIILLAEPIHALVLGDRRIKAIVYILAVTAVLPSIAYFPDYIPYFNLLAGGPENGYKYLSDSNIDWGQDLPGLKRYMDSNGIEVVNLAYSGRGIIEEYGIRYVSMDNNHRYMSTQRKPNLGCSPREGILAISITSLTGQYGDPACYSWLREMRPIADIGHSMLIYNITEAKPPPATDIKG